MRARRPKHVKRSPPFPRQLFAQAEGELACECVPGVFIKSKVFFFLLFLLFFFVRNANMDGDASVSLSPRGNSIYI